MTARMVKQRKILTIGDVSEGLNYENKDTAGSKYGRSIAFSSANSKTGNLLTNY